MPGDVLGGLPVVRLTAPVRPGRAGFVAAAIVPGRGFMALQATAALPSGEEVDAFVAPGVADAAAQLDGGPADFAGNRSFAFGGALLAPYANRIRGRSLTDAREIETRVGDQIVRLPRNWGGKAPGGEAYAMHGLILDQPAPFEQPDAATVRGALRGGRLDSWPGDLRLDLEWRLQDGALRLRLEARNHGQAATPFGAGWHPYLRLPSGRRAQATLHLPAERRAEVNDYDEVLPTGRLLTVAGTPYDFRRPRPLGALYLDDAFTGLRRTAETLTVTVADPAARIAWRVTTASPTVQAVQVYAPPDQPFVVVEPQLNLADPFGPAWPRGIDTGMVLLQPGETTAYEVALSLEAAP